MPFIRNNEKFGFIGTLRLDKALYTLFGLRLNLVIYQEFPKNLQKSVFQELEWKPSFNCFLTIFDFSEIFSGNLEIFWGYFHASFH